MIAFCLLTKFMVMRLTYNQLRGLLNTDDCPYIRALGLLYLRFPRMQLFYYIQLFSDPVVTTSSQVYL